MTTLPPRMLMAGRDAPPPDQIALRAGPLTLIYENGDLRYIRLGEHEILRRVYAAVRDHNWGTVPPQLSDVQIDAGDDSFRIQYQSDHRAGDIDFGWTGTIDGRADGTITFTFDGQARSTFQRNRIGFCTLHPMACAGQPCVVEHVDGSEVSGAFPTQIAPHQPFKDMRAITHEVVPGVRAEVRFSGDVFEMEDQRNWTDASYKTYCTPLGLPFPVTVEAGTRIMQSVTLTLHGDVAAVAGADAMPATVTVSEPLGMTLPRLGLGVASHGQPLSEQAITRLRALNLDHLRVDLPLDDAAATETRLRQAAEQAAALGVSLHVALKLTDNAADELARLRALIDTSQPRVSAWLVFHQGEKSTTAQWVDLARDHLASYAPEALFVGGTDAFFTELNRERPPLAALDAVTYSLNPQVHAFDNASLVETLAAQATNAASAHAFCGDLPVMVSPVTLRMRWNPNATGPQPPTPPGELPRQVDPRQMSLFGAGWTLGSVAYHAESDLYSVTYYETTGWSGVMETEAGSPLPAKFPSIPGGVFPMYHVLADIGEWAGAEVVACAASDPLAFEALALRNGNRRRVLIASFAPEPQTVTVHGLSGTAVVKTLDAENVEWAMRDPAAFRAATGAPRDVGPEGLTLNLAPYAITRIDTWHG